MEIPQRGVRRRAVGGTSRGRHKKTVCKENSNGLCEREKDATLVMRWRPAGSEVINWQVRRCGGGTTGLGKQRKTQQGTESKRNQAPEIACFTGQPSQQKEMTKKKRSAGTRNQGLQGAINPVSSGGKGKQLRRYNTNTGKKEEEGI